MKTTLVIIILLVLGVGGYALTKKDTAVPIVPTGEISTTTTNGVRGSEDRALSVGQTETILGLMVTLDTVSDSRCPTGVQCIWAGTVIASVTLAVDGETLTVDMTLNADPVEFEGYLISLTGASPYPKEGDPVDQKDHVLTFHVAPIVGSDGNIPANI